MDRKALVIADDASSGDLLRAMLERNATEVVVDCEDRLGRWTHAGASDVDLVLLDLSVRGRVGLERLERIKRTHPTLPVVVLTAAGDVDTALVAMQLGAFDCLTKPLDMERATRSICEALRVRTLAREQEPSLQAGSALLAEMGASPAIQEVVDQVRAVAASNFTVLITGETGTGKELVARAIHRQSERSQRAFVALDCGAIPETLLESELFGHEKGAFSGADQRKDGRFKLAHGGTFLLDEVANLPASLQPKLLRVLETKQVQPVGAAKTSAMDVRFVAATNDDLQLRMRAGMFRADLYFRLAQYTIALPPLRERREDIPYLARRFVDEVSTELHRPAPALSNQALEALQEHPWPGNVRELRNAVRQGVLETTRDQLGSEIAQHWVHTQARSSEKQRPTFQGKSLRELADDAARSAEREAICDALRQTHGNKSKAALLLKTDYKTLHVKSKQLGIRARDFAP